LIKQNDTGLIDTYHYVRLCGESLVVLSIIDYLLFKD